MLQLQGGGGGGGWAASSAPGLAGTNFSSWGRARPGCQPCRWPGSEMWVALGKVCLGMGTQEAPFFYFYFFSRVLKILCHGSWSCWSSQLPAEGGWQLTCPAPSWSRTSTEAAPRAPSCSWALGTFLGLGCMRLTPASSLQHLLGPSGFCSWHWDCPLELCTLQQDLPLVGLVWVPGWGSLSSRALDCCSHCTASLAATGGPNETGSGWKRKRF